MSSSARDDLAQRVFLALTQLGALLWFAVPVGLPLDDAWIHQVVARTFAESGTLGYAPGEHGAAATSYLWAALLALDFKWFHANPVWWAFALNAIALLGTGQLVFALLTRKIGDEVESRASRLTKLGAVLLACTGGNVLWYAHSGMEATLFVALSVLAVWAVTAPNASTRLSAVGGVAGALAALTRPEAAPLCAILVGYVVFRRAKTPRIAAVVVPALIAGVVYVGSNLAKTGHATPTTLSGRRWLWFQTEAGLSGLDGAADFAEAWIDRLASYTFDTGPLAGWLMVALAAHGAIRVLRVKNDGVRLLFAWAAMHTVTYAFLLPTPGHGGRYQPFVPLMYGACIAFGTAFVVLDFGRALLRSRGHVAEWLAFATVVPWLVFAFATTGSLREAHALAVAHIEGTELASGRFVDTLPRDGLVASFDIGGIAWAAHRPIIDAGGLSDPKTAMLMEKGLIWQHLKSRDVRYVVLPDGMERALPVVDDYVARLHLDSPAVRLTLLHESVTPLDQWGPGAKATWNAAPKQLVYRIEYTGEAGADDVPLVPTGALRPVRDDSALAGVRDRLRAERSLAVLAAWGVPISVQISADKSDASATSESDRACAVHFGRWGVDVAGCDGAVDARLLRSVLFEQLGRYLDVGDLGGALRILPHAVVAAKRVREPRFHPPLAPVGMPEGSPRPASAPWGIPLVLGILALRHGIIVALARRRRLAAQRPAAAPLSASAVAILLLIAAAPVALTGCKSADPGMPDWALMVAGDKGDVTEVLALLARGARVDTHDPDGSTSIHHAVRRGHHECVLVLARAGVNVDAVAGPRRRTALHEATASGSIDLMRALLLAGASTRVADTFGETPLHLVARVDPARAGGLAPLLLASGADPRAVDARGFTVAHAAAAADRLTLLRDVASVSSMTDVTPSGETAFDTAMRYEHELAADLLLRSGAKPRNLVLPPLHDAARIDAANRVALLLAAGADPLGAFEGKTALDVAMEHGSLRAAPLLRQAARVP